VLTEDVNGVNRGINSVNINVYICVPPLLGMGSESPPILLIVELLLSIGRKIGWKEDWLTLTCYLYTRK